jgi:hypothetical protein
VIVDGRFVVPTGARFPRRILPAFDCYIDIPALKCGHTALLLFDTGGEQTAIMPRLGLCMNVPYGSLTYPLSGGGVGRARYCEYPAIVAFRDKIGNFRNYPIDVAIFNPADVNPRNHSLLGRDIISTWKVLYDYPKGRLWARM